MTKTRGPALALVAIAILVAAITLRPGATSVGPVLAEISTGLSLSGATAGLLTALPGFMFALAGFLAVPISRRLGIGVSIAGGLALVIVALFLRPFLGSAWVFVLLSALALAGMAMGNVLVPAVIRIFGRDRPGLLSAFYATGLAVGGAAPPLLAGALIAVTGGWQEYLASWAWLAVAALALWLVLLVAGWRQLNQQAMRSASAAPGRDVAHPATDPLPTVRAFDDGGRQAARSHPDQEGAERGWQVAEPPASTGGHDVAAAQLLAQTRVWRSPTAVALTLFFAVQSTNAYVQFGWLAQVYRDGGLSLGTASAMIGMIAALGIPGGFVMPLLVSRSPHLAGWITGMGLCMVGGYAGLLVAPSFLPLVWALLLGLGSLAFPTALALITARSRDPHVTARLSGFVQPTGYLMAGFGPLLIGVIHGWTGSWDIPLVLLLLSSAPLVYFGRRVARGGYVDDELKTTN